MLTVEITEQEKKDLAVIYGFLVDVWTAQQHKADCSAVLKRAGDKSVNHSKN